MATEALPHVGTGLRLLDAPTDYLAELRTRHGDTFFVDVFGFPLLVTFSSKGLESLYKLAEDDASFGLATFDLLGFKTPEEIFADASTELFYELLAQRHMQNYVGWIGEVVDTELASWSGDIDLFDAVRTLEQRVGYALWIAPEAAGDRWWRRLKAEFDVLDQERAFVDPHETLRTIKSGKAAERAAVARIAEIVGEIESARRLAPETASATIDILRDRFAAEPPEIAWRKLVHSAINLNNGFLSNLYAAIGWMIVQLLLNDEARNRTEQEIVEIRARFGDEFAGSVSALDRMGFLEQVMMESVRLSQSSITLRKVMRPIEFDDGTHRYQVEPGVYVTTMLSVRNRETPALRRFDPDRYNRMRPKPALVPHGLETVSTFGHGKHACPALRFSHYMAKIVLAKLLDRFTLEPLFADAEPSPRQLGGVARPHAPLHVRLTRR